MHMNVAAPVMPVRVGADQRLMSGEMLFAKLLAQLLRPVNGQSIFGAVTGGKADDVVVALYVLPFLVFSVAEICPHTGDCKILPLAIQRRNAVVCPRYQMPVRVKGGLHGKLVMLE